MGCFWFSESGAGGCLNGREMVRAGGAGQSSGASFLSKLQSDATSVAMGSWWAAGGLKGRERLAVCSQPYVGVAESLVL